MNSNSDKLNIYERAFANKLNSGGLDNRLKTDNFSRCSLQNGNMYNVEMTKFIDQ